MFKVEVWMLAFRFSISFRFGGYLKFGIGGRLSTRVGVDEEERPAVVVAFSDR